MSQTRRLVRHRVHVGFKEEGGDFEGLPRKRRPERVSGFWLPPPWQAAAGFNAVLFEILVKSLRGLAAIALAQPTRVAMFVPAQHFESNEASEALSLQ